MTIELIDQSNPNALVFRCDRCDRTFTQPNWAGVELHVQGPFTPQMLDSMRKARIPACEPAPAKPKKAEK